jgi:hypothetical protein
MNYEEYIASPEWAAKRKARLELDGHRCRLCDEDGSRYQLEVHHRPTSYAKIPNESIEDDLITVCARCHNAITDAVREDRYGKRVLPEPNIIENNIPERFEVPNKESPQLPIIGNNVPEREEIAHGLEKDRVQVDIISPADNAQRADGRPNKQVVQINQTDFIKANKNRRGL